MLWRNFCSCIFLFYTGDKPRTKALRLATDYGGPFQHAAKRATGVLSRMFSAISGKFPLIPAILLPFVWRPLRPEELFACE